MANIYPSNILRVIGLIPIVGGMVLFLILPLTQLFTNSTVLQRSNKDNYDTDIKRIFHLAQRLGYTKENELNFYRIPPNSESNTDATLLIFRTSSPLGTFSQKVQQLGLPTDETSNWINGKEYEDRQYLIFINKPFSDSITITGTPSEIDESYLPISVTPKIARWDFYFSEPEEKKRLMIQFAQLPNKDLFWKDKQSGKIIDGPIVVLWLTR